MQRILFLDAIKALAILLVIFYHGNMLDKNFLVNPDVTTFIHYFFQCSLSVCVPLFFMVNGALVLNKRFSLRDNVERIIRIFFLTYIWGAILLLLLKYICSDTYTIRGFLSSLWHLKPPRINHLWFLKTLISIYILLPLFKLGFDHEKKSALYSILLFVFIFSFGNNLLNQICNLFGYFGDYRFNFFPIVNPFGNCFYAIFYFLMGGILFKSIAEKRFNFHYSLPIVLFFIFQLALFLYGIFMTKLNNAYYDVVWGGYDTVMTLVMTISIFLLLSKFNYKNTKTNRIISYVGKNTFGIYLLHVIFITLFWPLLQSSIYSNTFIANIAYVIVVMMFSFGLNEVLKTNRITSILLKI